MILDTRAKFSEDQAITATADSTSSIDQGALGVTNQGVQLLRKSYVNKQVELLVQVTETFDNCTSITIQLESDDDVNFGSPTIVQSIVVPLAELIAGYQIPQVFLPIIEERYLQMSYVLIGTAPSVGKITAGIVASVDKY